MGQGLFQFFSNVPDQCFQNGTRNNFITNQKKKLSMTFWGKKSS